MAIVKLQYEPIDVFYLYQQLKNKQYGGVVVFTGTVREWTGKIQTKGIEYTAYQEMAIKELEKLTTEVEKNGASAIVVHRLGNLALTEEAVFVGVAAPHRKEAFAACQYIIDHLKETVPIWKKEIDTDEIRWGGGLNADKN
ncbi:molybdopterin converting factor, large subunit [Tetragenococcus halophilus subsp. flandriensis]|uniref:molybdenum cofactor biosynthesis protein MoaE n=1 Tax=Tetragenococcus halophilus TaxID=51669 RepID=UPI0023EA4A43|nr:molybdenum cofactor biosynthesis protein MoaE [Tetragenococcus halophilus]GMA07592.1 molybdopterin converting factor, large subunit [Tetragenococcus halophilus subsp. flandriensis]